jgi:C4-dicarboxylate transporter, DctM subunit
MSGIALALTGFAVMLLLIGLRAPIGLSMLLVGAFGYSQLTSFNAFFSYMKTNSYHQFANYTLSVIPLFILMGALGILIPPSVILVITVPGLSLWLVRFFT